MTPLLFLAVACAGGVGAGLRYIFDSAVTRMLGGRVPWGILAVNLIGAFAIGLLTATVNDATGGWLIGTGLLGGYTTFSSVAVSTVVLAEEGRSTAATFYALGTFFGSVVAALLGLMLGDLLF